MSDGLNRRQFFVATAAFGTLRSYQSNSQQQGQPAGSFMPALCKFTAGVHYDSIPPKALATARTAIIDCLGVAVAGSKEDSAQIIGKMVREEAAKEEATAYGMRYEIVAPLRGPTGKSMNFRSIWQIDTGTQVPRLITMYPR